MGACNRGWPEILGAFLSLWLTVLGCATLAPESSGSLDVFWLYPAEKDRATPVPLSERRSDIQIYIAGNEYELSIARIVNEGPRTLSLTGLKALLPASDLRLRLFLLGNIDIQKKSRWFDPASVLGEWPDPCIPLDLQLRGQVLSWSDPEALALAPGASVSLLFEWYATAEFAERGQGKPAVEAEVLINFADQSSQSLSVSLQSTGFALPWEPSFATAVGINYQRIMDRHRALNPGEFDEEELWLAYLRELGEHRLYPYNADPARYPLDERDAFDPEAFDRIQGALLDGTLFETVPPATSLRFRPPPARLGAEQQRSYYGDVARHLAEKGQAGKLYYYTLDEPLITDFEAIKALASTYKAAMPGLRVLVTEPYTSLLAPEVDIWCPDIFSLGDSLVYFPLFAKGVTLHPDFHYNPPPSVYRSEQDQGKEFWLYTCTSAQALDYPNLFIDSPAAYHRILPWIMQRYGATGFLYYSATVAYRAGDPWVDQFYFESNGDGTLFYPGHTGIPFVEKHIPVASLRMKILRDGFEDYEYLELLKARRGNEHEAAGRVYALARTSLSFKKDLRDLTKAREDLIHALSN